MKRIITVLQKHAKNSNIYLFEVEWISIFIFHLLYGYYCCCCCLYYFTVTFRTGKCLYDAWVCITFNIYFDINIRHRNQNIFRIIIENVWRSEGESFIRSNNTWDVNWVQINGKFNLWFVCGRYVSNIMYERRMTDERVNKWCRLVCVYV